MTSSASVEQAEALDPEVAELLAPIREKREALNAEAEQYREQLAAVEARMARFDAMIEAASPTTKRKGRPKGERAQQVGADVIEAIFADIKEHEPTTRTEVQERVALHKSTVERAIKKLRSDERIRIAGERPSETGGRAHKLLAVMPDGST